MTPPPPEFPGWFAPLLEVVDRMEAPQSGLFAPPRDRTPRRSAVLILFGEGEAGPDVLLTERAADLRSHAGQVAFPGGAVDPEDGGPIGAALREAQEETGLDPHGVQVAGLLPELYLMVSDFMVTPVVAWWRDPSPVGAANPGEVARAVRVPVADLVDPANRFRVTHPSGYVGPGFSASGLFVWGFTAGILDRLLHLTGWEQPWDRAREQSLPPSAVRSRPASPPTRTSEKPTADGRTADGRIADAWTSPPNPLQTREIPR